MLAVAEGDLRDGDAIRIQERLAQQRVRLRGSFLRLQVVRALVIDSAGQLLILDEPLDLHGPARLQWQLREVLLLEDDEAIFLVLIAAENVVPCDLVVAARTPALVLDRCLVLRAEQAERDRLALRREV